MTSRLMGIVALVLLGSGVSVAHVGSEAPRAVPVLVPPALEAGGLALRLGMGVAPLSRSGFAVVTTGLEARVEPHRRAGRVSVGAETQGNLLLHFDWRTGSAALGGYDIAIHPSLNLPLFGRWYRLAAPDIRVCPRAGGGPDVQLHLSLFERRF